MMGVYAPPVRLVALFVGLLAMLATTLAFPGVAGAQTNSRVIVPVTGKLSDGGTFKGRIISPDVEYNSANDRLGISGILAGTATKANGATEAVRKEFTTNLRVAQGQQQECDILTLDIGRIFLDLLGLQVDIAPISINVTAVPGAGNLLGNLLCAVAGLLDPNSALVPLFAGVVLHPRSSIGVRGGGVSCACAIVNVTQVLHQASKELRVGLLL
jgi:hypothetical protein